MCEAGREETFDELSAWISGPTLTRHSHLMSTHRGFFMPGDPGTPQIPEIREAGKSGKPPLHRRNGKSDESPPAIQRATNTAVNDSDRVSGFRVQ